MSPKNKLGLITLIFILLPVHVLAQSGHSPYSGQQDREIKALSPDDINGYLNGGGMGLAKAAELNHYPGPRHVLDLSSDLVLSADQIQKTEVIYNAMHEDAVRLGKQIIEKERELDTLFSTGTITGEELKNLVRKIAQLQGELRIIHLQAHLKMKQILSKKQIGKYDELRGYRFDESPESHDHHRHGKH